MAKALNALHDGFFLSKYKRVHLVLVGVGTVGGTMLDQLRDQTDFLKMSTESTSAWWEYRTLNV